jgi:ABC-type transport system involved in multi-copper enzyme maturation permease subunit
MNTFYIKNILILYQKEFQRLKHNPSALMAVGLLVLMAFLVNIETKSIQRNQQLQKTNPCLVTYTEETPLIKHLKQNRNPKVPVQFNAVQMPDIAFNQIHYHKNTDCVAEIVFIEKSKQNQRTNIAITFRTNQKDQTKLHGFSRWLLSSMAAFYSDFSIKQSIEPFKNKSAEKNNTGFDLSNAKSKAMVSAMLIFSAQYFICCALFISLTSSEKEKGVLHAISLTTASPRQILIAKVLFHLTLSIIAVVMMIGILRPRWLFSLNALYMVGPTVVLSSIALILVASMIVCFSKTQTSASLTGFCYLMLIGVVFALSQNFAGFALLKTLMFENHTISLYGIVFDDSMLGKREQIAESMRFLIHLAQLLVITAVIIFISNISWRKRSGLVYHNQ